MPGPTTGFRLATVVVLLAASLAWVGCDSSEEELSDRETFVGTWRAVSATTPALSGVDLLAFLQAELTITLTETDYTLQLTTPNPEQGLDAEGAGYVVDESARTITFPAGEEIPEDVQMQYVIGSDNDTVTLTFDGALLGALGVELPGGVSLAGQPITLVVERLS